MRVFYDTEFIERGPTSPIELVSIGLVAEDGREFYAVSSEFRVGALHSNPWLVEHVWPSLPQRKHPQGLKCRCLHGHLDVDHPDVRSRAQIARAILDFLKVTPQPELWAWYGAYDHVVLAQLFGTMADLPDAVPMWTNDLRQEARHLGIDPAELPQQQDGHHNALADARHLRRMATYIDELHQHPRYGLWRTGEGEPERSGWITSDGRVIISHDRDELAKSLPLAGTVIREYPEPMPVASWLSSGARRCTEEATTR